MITFKCLRQLYSWSINSGLYNLTQKLKVENVSKDLDSCLTYFEGLNENVILILKYIHSYFNTHGMADRNIVRRMRDDDVDNLIKAGIIHLWFVILHPFDDGNGRSSKFTQNQVGHAKSTTMMDWYAQNSQDMIEFAQETFNKIFNSTEKMLKKNGIESENKIISMAEYRNNKGI